MIWCVCITRKISKTPSFTCKSFLWKHFHALHSTRAWKQKHKFKDGDDALLRFIAFAQFPILSAARAKENTKTNVKRTQNSKSSAPNWFQLNHMPTQMFNTSKHTPSFCHLHFALEHICWPAQSISLLDIGTESVYRCTKWQYNFEPCCRVIFHSNFFASFLLEHLEFHLLNWFRDWLNWKRKLYETISRAVKVKMKFVCLFFCSVALEISSRISRFQWSRTTQKIYHNSLNAKRTQRVLIHVTKHGTMISTNDRHLLER